MARLALVELVGPPGAGKSTVLEALRRHEDVALMPILRRTHRAALAAGLVWALGAVGRRGALSRRWSFELLVMTAYLRALVPVLEGPRRPRGHTLVFDQGPLYTLSQPLLRDQRLSAFRRAELDRWRARLDVVVWLDAPDATLAERIDTRAKAHRYKGAAEAEVIAGLAADRAVYAEVLDRLEAGNGGPSVLRFDTSRQSAGEIATAVLAAAGHPR